MVCLLPCSIFVSTCFHLCHGLAWKDSESDWFVFWTKKWLNEWYRLRGRVAKSVGYLDHVWSYGVREVVSSIPDRGNIVGWVFHPDQVTGKVFSSEHAFPSKFWIYLEHCPRVGSSNYRPSAPFLYEVASHVKKLPFRPLLLIRSNNNANKKIRGDLIKAASFSPRCPSSLSCINE